MRRCSCAKGTQRNRCSCKDFEGVADKGGSVLTEALQTCSCGVRDRFGNCDIASHIRALDYRAATFESMGELKRAKADAEWLLEVAPRRAEVGLAPNNVVTGLLSIAGIPQARQDRQIGEET
jgi:F-box/TPR repeat protein Pof3